MKYRPKSTIPIRLADNDKARRRRFSRSILRVSLICTAVIAAPICSGAASSDAVAQTMARADPDAKNEAPKTLITLLGTAGGPIPRSNRSQPASVLSIGDRQYLIDAGDGVARQMVAAGLPITSLKHVFLTHLHGDHVGGLPALMMFNWTNGRRDPLPIDGPPGTAALVKGGISFLNTPLEIFRVQFPPMPQLKDVFVAREPGVSPGDKPTVIYSDDLVRVSAIENSHYSAMKRPQRAYGLDRSYSYRFDTPDRSIVFTGDTGPSAALTALAKGADVLVTEVIDLDKQLEVFKTYGIPEDLMRENTAHMKEEHIRPEDIGKLAADAGVKEILLTHFVPGEAGQTDMTPFVMGIRKYFSGPVHVGSDLMSL